MECKNWLEITYLSIVKKMIESIFKKEVLALVYDIESITSIA